MNRQNRELWYALAAIVATTVVYFAAFRRSGTLPAASQLLGHGIGILGFVLMLMTETLYSLRKQSASARWGSMSSWLRFHVFTGLVGPYMVLLHPAARFNGLAGAVTLLTVIIVISGVIGRYIYTALPRTLDGAEMQVSDLEREIALTAHSLAGSLSPDGGKPALAFPATARSAGPGAVLGRAWQDTSGRWRDWRATRGLDAAAQRRVRNLQAMIRRRQALERQLDTLIAARNTLALWRSIHVPLAMVLFVTALVHIAGAIYYATLLR